MKARRIWHLVIGVAIAPGTLAAVGSPGVAAPRADAAGQQFPGNPGNPQFPTNPG
jgi:hypothetical protein